MAMFTDCGFVDRIVHAIDRSEDKIEREVSATGEVKAKHLGKAALHGGILGAIDAFLVVGLLGTAWGIIECAKIVKRNKNKKT